MRKEQIRDQEAMLAKLGIEALNPMQLEAQGAIMVSDEVILLSPTGTGKTLAYLLPVLSNLDPRSSATQVLILTPSRELAMQTEQVLKEMGSGFRVIVVYGGRASYKDKMELKTAPSILIGTPGRVADHIRRERIQADQIKTLVLDEFDKSLEVGFEKEMSEILEALTGVEKKILTSATQNLEIPEFVNISNPMRLDYLTGQSDKLVIKQVVSKYKDKLEGLGRLLTHLKGGNGIVFCNYKNTIGFVSEFLKENKIDHTCFFGGMEQFEREQALTMFRNGTHRILLATDLAARGIDIENLDFIIHYQMPLSEAEFTHRNGRTARMQKSGAAYILTWEEEILRDYVGDVAQEEIPDRIGSQTSDWSTLFISAGRRDKISKGDIAGMFFKLGKLKKDELGMIELKSDSAYVAVKKSKAKKIVQQLNNQRLKKTKVRIRLLS